MLPLPPVLFDLQGAQSVDHRDRGVARYVTSLAGALEARSPGQLAAYIVNPDLMLPADIEPLVASGKLRFCDEPDVYADGSILHLASPFELSIPIDRILPPAARTADLRLVTTVFDLIPAAMPEVYLEDPGLARRYRARLDLVRRADLVLPISQHTASETTRILGIDERRQRVVALAASNRFRPAPSRHAAAASARAVLPDLGDRFVLYTGGSDGRKNLEALLEAWALQREDIRRTWQLVVAGSLPPLRRNHLEVMAENLGLATGLLLTGFVDEPILVALNQSADLFVFPSLAEGFGLPAAEALACGTPTIVSDSTSLVELVPAEARFDPTDPTAMAKAIATALTDDDLRRRLVEFAARPTRTWTHVADETLAAYDAVTPHLGRHSTRRAKRDPLRLAFVSPLPPQRGGVADYSFRLLEQLRSIGPVDAFVDGPPHQRQAVQAATVPGGVSAYPVAALDRVEALEGRYDAIVYSLGNSEYHTGSLAQLGRRPGIVLAHDVRLTNLYRFAQWQHPDAVGGGFHQALHRMYPGGLPLDVGADGWLSPAEADRWGALMAREVIAASTRFATMSAFAAELARLDARPEHRDRIVAVPFGIGGGTSDATPRNLDGPKIVASFGVVHSLKQGPFLVEAFASATAASAGEQARLVFVGPAGDQDAADIRSTAERLKITDRVEVTGAVPAEEYRSWLSRATVAVQLRASTNGESSAATGDCLAAGLPTVVTAIGAARELPEGVACGLAPDATVAELAALLSRLLSSDEDRQALANKASAYAAEHTFARAAAAVYELVRSSSGTGRG